MSSKVSDFTFVRRIGRGGFGEVYEATRLSDGKQYALKVIDKRKLKKELYRKVLNEIEIHKTLNYPSVVRMYDAFEDANFMYLVLEYCSNGDLHHFLKKRGKPLPEQEARELFAQLVDGIVYLHSLNIVHRDISLNNLLLTKNFTLKISDFGLAKRLSGPHDTHRTMCGTPNFMSPETLSNGGRGFMGDCWSLGCVLFHLLTGELPFEDEGVNEILRRVKENRFHIPHSVSVDARSLIGLLLQADPENRVTAKEIMKHSFMAPISQVFSGESADSGHGTLDSNEFADEDEAKFKQFLPTFIPLHSYTDNKPHKQASFTPPPTTTSNNITPTVTPKPISDRTSQGYLPVIRDALRRSRPTSTPVQSPIGPVRVTNSRTEPSSTLNASQYNNATLLTQHDRNTKPDCLTTTRLTPRIQKRKGLEVEIHHSGSISLRRQLEKGIEEFTVSGNGMNVTVSLDNSKQLSMSYSTLQPRWYSRYAKLEHIVEALKACTPKITIHSEKASAFYMENGPVPNFHVLFKDGTKLVREKTKCHITDLEKKVTMVTQTMTPCFETNENIERYCELARKLYEQCRTVEKCLDGLLAADTGLTTVYPVRMGYNVCNHAHRTPHHPTSNDINKEGEVGTSSFTSCTTDTTTSFQSGNVLLSRLDRSNFTPDITFSTRTTSTPIAAPTSTLNAATQAVKVVRDDEAATCSPRDMPIRAPLAPLPCKQLLPRVLSSTPQASPPSHYIPYCDNKENQSPNKTLQNSNEQFIKYKPNVGWIGFCKDGVKMKFKDEAELVVDTSGAILYKQANGGLSRATPAIRQQYHEVIAELQFHLNSSRD